MIEVGMLVWVPRSDGTTTQAVVRTISDLMGDGEMMAHVEWEAFRETESRWVNVGPGVDACLKKRTFTHKPTDLRTAAVTCDKWVPIADLSPALT